MFLQSAKSHTMSYFEYIEKVPLLLPYQRPECCFKSKNFSCLDRDMTIFRDFEGPRPTRDIGIARPRHSKTCLETCFETKTRLETSSSAAHKFFINLNLNFAFPKSMNLNLNFVFSKSMNLNLYFVFSTSVNLNILIKQLMNFEFFDLNHRKLKWQFVTGLYQLMLQTFHKILSIQQKIYDGNYDAARRFDVVFGPQ